MNPRIKLLLLSICACGFALPSLHAASFTASPVSDAFVASGPTGNLANSNYGGGGALALAAPGLPNGEFQSVIKFDLSGARSSFDAQCGAGLWSIQSVSLQLTSSPHTSSIYNDVAPGTFNISLMQNNGWTEGTGKADTPAANGITFSSLQNTFINSATDQPLGTFSFNGQSSGANQYTLQLSSGLTSDILSGGSSSLRLYASDNAVSYLFTSRSGGGTAQPQLMISVIPEPGVLALLGVGFVMLLLRSALRRLVR